MYWAQTKDSKRGLDNDSPSSTIIIIILLFLLPGFLLLFTFWLMIRHNCRRGAAAIMIMHSTAHKCRTIRYDHTRIRTLRKKQFLTLGSFVSPQFSKLDIVLDIFNHQRNSG